MTDVERQERSDALKRLDAFVGKWTVELVFRGDQAMKAQTEGSFEWLDKDHTFLIYRLGTEGRGSQSAYCLIGGDDTTENYTVLYSDNRGVARIYHMSLKDGEWKQWRDDPSTFSQRFSGTFSKDGRTINAKWEINEDGNWKLDFDMTYTKIG